MPLCLDNAPDAAVISISGIATPEEGDELLAMLRENPGAAVDLSGLEHLHTALLQILLTVKPTISAWPEDEFWKKCLIFKGEN